MGQTLAERIQYEAAYDRNLIFKAYAGDLADLMSDLTARAERAEAAANDCRRVIAAIPWRALASIYTHPGVVLDADADAIGEFLDQYADEWAGGFGLRLIEEKQLERQAEDYARSLAVSVPSDESEG